MRPHVICHMVTSIDGKILSNRWGKIPGPKTSAQLYETTAASFGIGAWIVGTNTMDEFDGKHFALKSLDKIGRQQVDRADHIAQPGAKKFAIGVDARARLRFQTGEVDGDHTVVIITKRASDAYVAHLQKAGVSYLFAGTSEIDLPLALQKLRRVFGIKKLMLEGGGKFNGAMLHAGLVDEVSQIIVPVVDGGVGVSSIFDIDIDSAKAAAKLRVMSHKRLPGGAQWLRYRVRAKIS